MNVTFSNEAETYWRQLIETCIDDDVEIKLEFKDAARWPDNQQWIEGVFHQFVPHSLGDAIDFYDNTSGMREGIPLSSIKCIHICPKEAIVRQLLS